MSCARTLREFAPAKINLALHVVGRRADGYHLLDSLVVFADTGDELRADPAKGLSLAIEGPAASGLEIEGNLVLRAAEALAREARIAAPGAALRLDKRLPVASGIGGGSSDAAAALRALNRLWGLGFDAARLARIGEAIGADVPVCVHARAARMRGIGERLDPVAISAIDLVLVNPGVPLSTAAVFSRLAKRDNHELGNVPALASAAEVADYLGTCRNDLEPPARAAEPAVGTALDALGASPGCRMARMSGSGATCFGLFADGGSAEAAAARLAGEHPRWWVAACRTLAAA